MFEQYGKQVKALEEKHGVFGFGSIYKVHITYSNEDDFFIGWVDSNFMPILFGRVREERIISDDIAYPIKNFIKCQEDQEIDYRLAELSDKNEIIDLRFQSFFDRGTNCISALMAFEQEFDDKHLTIAACAENKIVGLIYGFNPNEKINTKEEYYIEYIYVHQNFRNKNIGSFLFKKMEKIIIEKGFKKITARIQGRQEHANTVYNFNLKNGFKNNKDDVVDLGHGFISLNMEKDLLNRQHQG